MTNFPVYTLDHVRAALGKDAADKLRDYVPPPPVSPELRLARECATQVFEDVHLHHAARSCRLGNGDSTGPTQAALLALQRRHELDTPAEPQADDDGWIPWSGGECPVPLDSKPGVRFRNGHESAVYVAARSWNWTHLRVPSDIIAYKPDTGN